MARFRRDWCIFDLSAALLESLHVVPLGWSTSVPRHVRHSSGTCRICPRLGHSRIALRHSNRPPVVATSRAPAHPPKVNNRRGLRMRSRPPAQPPSPLDRPPPRQYGPPRSTCCAPARLRVPTELPLGRLRPTTPFDRKATAPLRRPPQVGRQPAHPARRSTTRPHAMAHGPLASRAKGCPRAARGECPLALVVAVRIARSRCQSSGSSRELQRCHVERVRVAHELRRGWELLVGHASRASVGP